VLAASGCGAVKKVGSGDVAHGKELFSTPGRGGASCSACHTLADAGATGTVGPNLDDAFSSDKQQGFSRQTMADIVRGQMAYPDPKGPMPADLFTGQDATDIALYVAQCSAVPHCGVTAEKPAAPMTTAPSSGGTTTTAGGGGALALGKHVFQTAGCSGCHTLKDAGATGNVGPNLDTLKPSDAKVQTQVENGGGQMPPFKNSLSAAQIAAVAKYVSSVAGK
jgi:mono/diheme cytochrome c family protein